jgi:hypothetical protein
MGAHIRKPTARQCEDCGRREIWNETTCTWRIAVTDDDERLVGNPYCIHEWDINGTFVPLKRDPADA